MAGDGLIVQGWYGCVLETAFGDSILRLGGGVAFDDGKWVVRLDLEWGPLLGSEASPTLFECGVLWLGQWKALLLKVRH